MKRSMSPSSVLLASFSLCGALLAGCPGPSPTPDGGDPKADGGDPATDGGDPTSDGGDPTNGGESCTDATVITPGTVQGTTAGASNDHEGACDTFSEQPGGDVVYRFTLAEESGVNLSVSGYDAVLYVYEGSACAEEAGCTDVEGTSEALSFPALPAGDYFVVVDTYIGVIDQDGNRQDDGAPFTLTLEVVDPYCAPDQFDPAEGDTNNTAAGAIGAGFQDIDTQELDPSTPEPDAIGLSICADDVDYFAIGHLGGALNVSVTGVGGDAAPDFELLSATATVADGDITGYTEGAAVTNGEAQDRGVYLLKVSAATVPATGLDYGFAVTHGCQGDQGDSFVAELDDGDLNNAPTFFFTPDEPVARAVCGGDTDSFVLNNLVAGDVTVTLAGGSTLNVSAFSVAEDAAGARTATALTEGTDYTTATAGSDLTVTFAGAAAGLYMITVGTDTTTDVAYTFSAAFAGLAGPPDNDTCATRTALTAGEAPTPLFGRTLGGTHTLAGPTVGTGMDAASCNGDGEVVPDTEIGPAPEVFYYLNLADPVDLELLVDGSATDFSAALYLLNLPGQTCPADLTTLTPVQVNDAPVCETGVKIRARVPQAPAGDYLVVVDGQYFPPFEFFGIQFPESKTEGAFEVSAKTYPQGFPPPQACVDATAAAVPAAGTPTTFTVDFTGAPQELSGGCGGGGAERVFTLSPDADVNVTISVGGGENDVDTVAYLFSGTCDETTAAATSSMAGTCNDDDGSGTVGNLGSLLTATLTGGTTYYLVVDAYSATEGSAGVSIAVAQ